MRRDPGENEQKLMEVALVQGGYFTARQADRAGYYYRLQHFHRSRGNWLSMGRGIFRLKNFPASDREDLIRLSLWSMDRKGRPQAVVSHQTAISLHELGDISSRKIHLTVPPSFRKPVPDGCVLHRDRLTAMEYEEHQGYRVTTPLRSILDLERSPVESDHLLKIIKDALAKGAVTHTELARHPRIRRILQFNQKESFQWDI